MPEEEAVGEETATLVSDATIVEKPGTSIELVGNLEEVKKAKVRRETQIVLVLKNFLV